MSTIRKMVTDFCNPSSTKTSIAVSCSKETISIELFSDNARSERVFFILDLELRFR
ncbi:hypothetical protein M413DRAFT_441130 [Hebeloma cylindrosporum]|uniref:Uncharacterized protein n=1 Tax=Hebeloma cylindrosporum TaxID=76867 RepID=A0A0C3CQB8_HEBCY|nr:hypothetical protein M413DRAFT_441130 [Hebeloma cylindrosporum h7]